MKILILMLLNMIKNNYYFIYFLNIKNLAKKIKNIK